MADEVNQYAIEGGASEQSTATEIAARTAAIEAANTAAAEAVTAKVAADQVAYSAAIAAEEACASSIQAIVNVDPHPPDPEE